MMESIVNCKELKQDIISSSKAIRKKYKQLKITKLKQEKELMTTFKPIVEPLNKLISLKKEIFNNDVEIDRLPETQDEIEERLVKLRTKESGVLASNYVMLHLDSTNKSLDTTYGIRFNGSTLQLGNATMLIKEDKIIIDKEEYDGTEGLYELLFMKKPDINIYNKDDLEVYKNLVLKTNAHKRNYDVSKQVRSNKGHKYLQIIKPLVSTSTRGSGMLANTPRYDNWDDPNELVDRLHILWSLQCAGNNSHHDEILYIVEELRKAKLIQ
jgi:hypothetical protein